MAYCFRSDFTGSSDRNLGVFSGAGVEEKGLKLGGDEV